MERKESGEMGLIDKLDSEVEKIKEEMCDRYCKWPAEYGDCDDDLIKEKCERCPLCRL